MAAFAWGGRWLPTVVAVVASAAAVGCGRDRAGDASSAPCMLPGAAAQAPSALAATGCFDGDGQPNASLRAYTVNAPSYSNGAGKNRWLHLPAGGHATMDGTGSIALPPRAGVFKDFSIGDRRVETRLMMQNDDGSYAGLTWVWNEAQTEATLAADGATLTVAGLAWTVPTQAQCLRCHNSAGGRLLALRSEQLDRPGADGTGNQLDAWAADGTLVQQGNIIRPPAYPDPLGEAPLAARARSYLATNCSFCHQVGGGTNVDIDYRYATGLAAMGICDVAPTRGSLGLSDARLLAPGSPDRSVVSARLRSLDPARMMPPLGRNTLDGAGAAVIDAWISSLTDCSGP